MKEKKRALHLTARNKTPELGVPVSIFYKLPFLVRSLRTPGDVRQVLREVYTRVAKQALWVENPSGGQAAELGPGFWADLTFPAVSGVCDQLI